MRIALEAEPVAGAVSFLPAADVPSYTSGAASQKAALRGGKSQLSLGYYR
jgi:hypothetical protein